tara:strand:- start:410 stop:1120 length:711 start_codon:yes stop_codon:yes gene_type:complete
MKESNTIKSLFAKDRGMPKGANYPAAFEKKAFEKGKKLKNLFKGITVSGVASKLPKAAKNLGKVATVSRIARAATPIGLAASAAKVVYDVATMSPEKKAKVKKLKSTLSKTSTKDYHADLLKMSVGGDTMLKNPKKADLDKDGKLSSYEKKRGKAIEANMKAKKGKMMYANVGMAAKKVREEEIKKKRNLQVSDASIKASMGKSVRGYGAARTSGMGLQDEQLVPGKSLDYYKDLM